MRCPIVGFALVAIVLQAILLQGTLCRTLLQKNSNITDVYRSNSTSSNSDNGAQAPSPSPSQSPTPSVPPSPIASPSPSVSPPPSEGSPPPMASPSPTFPPPRSKGSSPPKASPPQMASPSPSVSPSLSPPPSSKDASSSTENTPAPSSSTSSLCTKSGHTFFLGTSKATLVMSDCKLATATASPTTSMLLLSYTLVNTTSCTGRLDVVGGKCQLQPICSNLTQQTWTQDSQYTWTLMSSANGLGSNYTLAIINDTLTLVQQQASVDAHVYMINATYSPLETSERVELVASNGTTLKVLHATAVAAGSKKFHLAGQKNCTIDNNNLLECNASSTDGSAAAAEWAFEQGKLQSGGRNLQYNNATGQFTAGDAGGILLISADQREKLKNLAPAPSPGPNVGLIVGAAVGGVVGLAIIAAILFYWMRPREEKPDCGIKLPPPQQQTQPPPPTLQDSTSYELGWGPPEVTEDMKALEDKAETFIASLRNNPQPTDALVSAALRMVGLDQLEDKQLLREAMKNCLYIWLDDNIWARPSDWVNVYNSRDVNAYREQWTRFSQGAAVAQVQDMAARVAVTLGLVADKGQLMGVLGAGAITRLQDLVLCAMRAWLRMKGCRVELGVTVGGRRVGGRAPTALDLETLHNRPRMTIRAGVEPFGAVQQAEVLLTCMPGVRAEAAQGTKLKAVVLEQVVALVPNA